MMHYKEVWSIFTSFIFYFWVFHEKGLITVWWMYVQEKEAKKEAFRKYLESSGVLDALTKGLLLSPSDFYQVFRFLM